MRAAFPRGRAEQLHTGFRRGELVGGGRRRDPRRRRRDRHGGERKGHPVYRVPCTEYLDPGLEGWARFPTVLPDTPEVTHHPFPGEIDDLVDAVLADREALVNIEEGVRTHELMFAAGQSAREGRPVKLPLPRWDSP